MLLALFAIIYLILCIIFWLFYFDVFKSILKTNEFKFHFLIKCRPNIAQMFSIMHKSVSDASKKMYLEIRRHNYVTPTNFLELTAGYKK